MAKLREKFKNLSNVVGPVSVDQTLPTPSTSVASTPNGGDQILRLIPAGSLLKSQDLLNVVSDLLYNDQQLNLESGSLPFLLTEGYFRGADEFNITAQNSTSFTIGGARGKVGETIFFFNGTQTFNTFAPIAQTDFYRRDFIEFHIDLVTNTYSFNVKTGQFETDDIPGIDTQLLRSSTTQDIGVYSVLLREVSGQTQIISIDKIIPISGIDGVLNHYVKTLVEPEDKGLYSIQRFNNNQHIRDNLGNLLDWEDGQSSAPELVIGATYTPSDFYESELTINFEPLNSSWIANIPFVINETLFNFTNTQTTSIYEALIAIKKSSLSYGSENISLQLYTADDITDELTISAVAPGITTTVTFTGTPDLTTLGIVNGTDFALVTQGNGLYQTAKITAHTVNTITVESNTAGFIKSPIVGGKIKLFVGSADTAVGPTLTLTNQEVINQVENETNGTFGANQEFAKIKFEYNTPQVIDLTKWYFLSVKATQVGPALERVPSIVIQQPVSGFNQDARNAFFEVKYSTLPGVYPAGYFKIEDDFDDIDVTVDARAESPNFLPKRFKTIARPLDDDAFKALFPNPALSYSQQNPDDAVDPLQGKIWPEPDQVYIDVHTGKFAFRPGFAPKNVYVSYYINNKINGDITSHNIIHTTTPTQKVLTQHDKIQELDARFTKGTTFAKSIGVNGIVSNEIGEFKGPILIENGNTISLIDSDNFDFKLTDENNWVFFNKSYYDKIASLSLNSAEIRNDILKDDEDTILEDLVKSGYGTGFDPDITDLPKPYIDANDIYKFLYGKEIDLFAYKNKKFNDILEAEKTQGSGNDFELSESNDILDNIEYLENTTALTNGNTNNVSLLKTSDGTIIMGAIHSEFNANTDVINNSNTPFYKKSVFIKSLKNDLNKKLKPTKLGYNISDEIGVKYNFPDKVSESIGRKKLIPFVESVDYSTKRNVAYIADVDAAPDDEVLDTSITALSQPQSFFIDGKLFNFYISNNDFGWTNTATINKNTAFTSNLYILDDNDFIDNVSAPVRLDGTNTDDFISLKVLQEGNDFHIFYTTTTGVTDALKYEMWRWDGTNFSKLIYDQVSANQGGLVIKTSSTIEKGLPESVNNMTDFGVGLINANQFVLVYNTQFQDINNNTDFKSMIAFMDKDLNILRDYTLNSDPSFNIKIQKLERNLNIISYLTEDDKLRIRMIDDLGNIIYFPGDVLFIELETNTTEYSTVVSNDGKIFIISAGTYGIRLNINDKTGVATVNSLTLTNSSSSNPNIVKINQNCFTVSYTISGTTFFYEVLTNGHVLTNSIYEVGDALSGTNTLVGLYDHSFALIRRDTGANTLTLTPFDFRILSSLAVVDSEVNATNSSTQHTIYFGVDGTDYVYGTAYTDDSFVVHFDIYHIDNTSGSITEVSSVTLTGSKAIHVRVVWDGSNGAILYLNPDDMFVYQRKLTGPITGVTVSGIDDIILDDTSGIYLADDFYDEFDAIAIGTNLVGLLFSSYNGSNKYTKYLTYNFSTVAIVGSAIGTLPAATSLSLDFTSGSTQVIYGLVDDADAKAKIGLITTATTAPATLGSLTTVATYASATASFMNVKSLYLSSTSNYNVLVSSGKIEDDGDGFIDVYTINNGTGLATNIQSFSTDLSLDSDSGFTGFATTRLIGITAPDVKFAYAYLFDEPEDFTTNTRIGYRELILQNSGGTTDITATAPTLLNTKVDIAADDISDFSFDFATALASDVAMFFGVKTEDITPSNVLAIYSVASTAKSFQNLTTAAYITNDNAIGILNSIKIVGLESNNDLIQSFNAFVANNFEITESAILNDINDWNLDIFYINKDEFVIIFHPVDIQSRNKIYFKKIEYKDGIFTNKTDVIALKDFSSVAPSNSKLKTFKAKTSNSFILTYNDITDSNKTKVMFIDFDGNVIVRDDSSTELEVSSIDDIANKELLGASQFDNDYLLFTAKIGNEQVIQNNNATFANSSWWDAGWSISGGNLVIPATLGTQAKYDEAFAIGNEYKVIINHAASAANRTLKVLGGNLIDRNGQLLTNSFVLPLAGGTTEIYYRSAGGQFGFETLDALAAKNISSLIVLNKDEVYNFILDPIRGRMVYESEAFAPAPNFQTQIARNTVTNTDQIELNGTLTAPPNVVGDESFIPMKSTTGIDLDTSVSGAYTVNAVGSTLWSGVGGGVVNDLITFTPTSGNWDSFAPLADNGTQAIKINDGTLRTINYYYNYGAFKAAFNGTTSAMIVTEDGSVYKGTIAEANLVVSGEGIVGLAGGYDNSITFTADSTSKVVYDDGGNGLVTYLSGNDLRYWQFGINGRVGSTVKLLPYNYLGPTESFGQNLYDKEFLIKNLVY